MISFIFLSAKEKHFITTVFGIRHTSPEIKFNELQKENPSSMGDPTQQIKCPKDPSLS